MLLYQKVLRFLIAAFFLVSLSIAWGAEHFYAIRPCLLCLYLRYVYVAILAVAGIFCFYPKHWLLTVKVGLIFAALSLSFFHLGVEQQWWEGPAVCSGEAINQAHLQGLTVDEKAEYLRQHFQGMRAVPCNQVNWRISSVSVTVWNTILLAFLFIGISILWQRQKIYTE